MKVTIPEKDQKVDLPNTVFKASVLKKLKELKLNVQKSRK